MARPRPSSPLLGPLAGALVAVAATLAPAVARADVDHIVAKGHTLEAIAARYHVTKRAILEKNPGMSASRLQPGDVLTIPTPKNGAKPVADKDAKDGKGAKAAKPVETKTYAQKPKTPGLMKVKRLATNEELNLTLPRGVKFTPTALHSFEKVMRSPTGVSHPIEPRLLALLRVVSNHFGGRPIEVVSGFRPFTTTQYNPHSNHNHGKAVDFRVVGVPNEVLRDYCRTLKNTGCGYYPNSVFVHMDARDKPAFWIDYSKPGEAPRYHAPGLDADEGQTEVHDEVHGATGTTPGDAPAVTPPPATTAPEPQGQPAQSEQGQTQPAPKPDAIH